MWTTTNCGKFLEIGIPDHLTCLLRNLYASQEATVRTGHGIKDWFQIRKGVRQSCILSPCLFNFYAEYIMRNAGLEESQAGIKIVERNINIPQVCRWHYPYGRKWRRTKEPLDESETVKKLAYNSTLRKLRSWLQPHHFMANRWGNSENSDRLYFGGLQNHCRWCLQPWN